jgi:hypothetical protein
MNANSAVQTQTAIAEETRDVVEETRGVTDDNKPTPKAKPGAAWKANETHVLPKNRLVIVFFGLMVSFCGL